MRTGQTAITYNHILRNPVWSPADTLIAFEMRDSDPRYSNIWVNGTPGQLTPQGSGTNANHAWSPDGSKLAFTSTRDGNGEIYIMTADGATVTRLTNNAAMDMLPQSSMSQY